MNVRKLILPALLLIGVALQAQFSKERERNIHLFKVEAQEIALSRAHTATKEARMVKLCSDYLASIATVQADEQLAKIHKYDGCDKSKIKKYVQTFLNDNKKVLTSDYLRRRGKKNDCALNAAVNLFELLGPSNLAQSDLCANGGCDKNSDKRMLSRGAKSELWYYTGEKKYVIDEEVSGWRYKCILVENVDDPREEAEEAEVRDEDMVKEGEMSEKKDGRNETKEDFEEDYSFEDDYRIVPDTDPVWKKQEMVDIWR